MGLEARSKARTASTEVVGYRIGGSSISYLAVRQESSVGISSLGEAEGHEVVPPGPVGPCDVKSTASSLPCAPLCFVFEELKSVAIPVRI
jgi:hypothetical protein